MKLLMLLQGREPDHQVGYDRAFRLMVTRGTLTAYHALPYLPTDPKSPCHWPRLYNNALELLRSERHDLLFLQFFHGPWVDPRPFITEARKINPDLIVLTSCGDPFGRWLHTLPPCMRQIASVADVTFSTSMGYLADAFVSAGAKNVVLMPNGACQERFSLPPPAQSHLDWDMVFIGSNNGGRNPFTHLSRAGRKRRAMVRALERRYGKKFALFGRGWEGHPSWQGPVHYATQHSVLWRSRLQVGGMPGSYATYYTSDRAYIALASGVPLLDCQVPGVETLMEPGRHWIPYRNIPDMLCQIDRMLDWTEADLRAIGDEARNFVLESHTQAHRAQEMIDIAMSLKSARSEGRVALPPVLRCFHSGVSAIREIPRAVKNWCG